VIASKGCDGACSTLLASSQELMALTTLQDYRTESGGPSGELKITEVPELPEKETAKAEEKED